MEDFLCYWGKAHPPAESAIAWHPAAYHSLDDAASALVLLQKGVSKAPTAWSDPPLVGIPLRLGASGTTSVPWT